MNRKLEHNESVVINFFDGGQSSGKVVNEVSDDVYLVMYMGSFGWTHGTYSAIQLVPFNGARFLSVENPFVSDVSEVSDLDTFDTISEDTQLEGVTVL